jgi:hypothetical protein
VTKSKNFSPPNLKKFISNWFLITF